MNRTPMLLAAAACLALARPALAADDADTTQKSEPTSAAGPTTPGTNDAKPPTLPDTASDRAAFVHENIAFGKKGEAERAAHRQAGKQGGMDADDAHADMANRAAHGAAGDMQREMDDNHSAATQQRDHREGMPSGGTSPTMPRGGH